MMDDIIIGECGYDRDIEEYRTLIVKRERLKKEGKLFLHEYLREFGELIEEYYNLKIECIKCKKIIAYCIAFANRGESVYMKELQSHIETVMQNYYEEIRIISNVINAKTHRISLYELHKIKKLYYQIVNMIHPDLHPKLFAHEEISLLWEQAKQAYENNDFDKLKEIEILIVAVIRKFGGKERKIEIENVKLKIMGIRKEIDEIINSDPYMFKYLLEDEEAVFERKNELRQKNEEYEEYLEELRLEVEKFQIEWD